MISNHALKKVRLSLSTWQLLLVSTRWQINLSPENKLLKQHNLGQFGCSSLVKKFGRNCLTYLINYQDSTKVWEIPQTLCVVGMTTYYGINFKNSKSVKIFQDMHWLTQAQNIKAVLLSLSAKRSAAKAEAKMIEVFGSLVWGGGKIF